MSKISSYGIVSPPVAGDLVIGTNTIDSNKTKNFRVEDIAALAATSTLSEVLTAGNTASNNLTLIGTLSITGTSVFNGSTQFGPTGTTDFSHLVEFDAITLEGTVEDGFSSVGTAGQVLSSTGTSVQWVDDSAPIPSLDQVLTVGSTSNITPTFENITINGSFEDGTSSTGTIGQVLSSTGSGQTEWIDNSAPIPTLAEVVTAGNTSSSTISLTGNVILGTGSFTNIQANGSLFINTLLVDFNDSSGTAGQVLSSTGSGVAWVDDSAPIPTLSEVLTAGSTSSSSISLFGMVTLGTAGATSIQANASLYLNNFLFDINDSSGTAGQVLSSTATGVAWVDDSAPIPTLAEVLIAGNTSSSAISLTGNVTLGTIGVVTTIQANVPLYLNTHLIDINNSSGTPGQVLTSSSGGPIWGDATDVKVLSSSTFLDQSLVASNLRKQVDFGTSVFNSYFNLAADGTITALIAGTYSISININSGSLLVGLGDQHVDFFYSVDLNDSQIQNTYQNTVYFDAQSSDPAQTLTIQFLQTLAANDTLKVYQAASLYIASGSNSMQSGLVAKTIGVTGMGGVPSAAINIDRV